LRFDLLVINKAVLFFNNLEEVVKNLSVGAAMLEGMAAMTDGL
jgi:hypothetical protein